MCVCCVRCAARGMARAVSNRLGRRRFHRFMVKMGLHPRFMGVRGYAFCSFRLMLQLTSRHPGRHCIADPAAHRQQGDHQGKEQDTHKANDK